MNLHDMLGVAMLLLQLTSWLSLRERLARLEGGLAEFKKATNRELDRLERQVSAVS